MTVGIAAISQYQPPAGPNGVLPPTEPVVILASDRMLTVGDREYEQNNQTKSYRLSDRIIILISGFGDDLLDICKHTASKAISGGLTKVEDVAYLFAAEFAVYRTAHNERRVLAPYGLDFDSFHRRQKEFDADFLRQRNAELNDWDYDIGKALVTGVDESGGHIYLVRDPGIARTCDQSGFATIGSGGEFADPSFMGVGYTSFFNWEVALWLVYSAKRRSEVAAGVGEATDLQWITRTGGTAYFGPVTPLLMQLDTIYKERITAENIALFEDHAKLLKILETMNEAPKTEPHQETDSDSASDDEERLPNGP